MGAGPEAANGDRLIGLIRNGAPADFNNDQRSPYPLRRRQVVHRRPWTSNLVDVTSPASFGDFVELVVPGLQQQRRMWRDCEGNTLRESRGGRDQKGVRDHHPPLNIGGGADRTDARGFSVEQIVGHEAPGCFSESRPPPGVERHTGNGALIGGRQKSKRHSACAAAVRLRHATTRASPPAKPSAVRRPADFASARLSSALPSMQTLPASPAL